MSLITARVQQVGDVGGGGLGWEPKNRCRFFSLGVTYWQRYALLGGSHDAASESDFFWLVGPSTARRFRGSLARLVRVCVSSCCAPFCQASRECDDM